MYIARECVCLLCGRPPARVGAAASAVSVAAAVAVAASVVRRYKKRKKENDTAKRGRGGDVG